MSEAKATSAGAATHVVFVTHLAVPNPSSSTSQLNIATLDDFHISHGVPTVRCL